MEDAISKYWKAIIYILHLNAEAYQMELILSSMNPKVFHGFREFTTVCVVQPGALAGSFLVHLPRPLYRRFCYPHSTGEENEAPRIPATSRDLK